MKLTHTRDNSLTALLVGVYCEGWVLLSELGETDTEFVNVSLALWLNSDTDHWIRECH